MVNLWAPKKRVWFQKNNDSTLGKKKMMSPKEFDELQAHTKRMHKTFDERRNLRTSGYSEEEIDQVEPWK